MRSVILVLIGAIVAGFLVWGGVEYHKQSVCAGLEDDYLNAVSRMRDATLSKASVERIMRPPASFDQIIKRESDKMATTLVAINGQCGSRSSETAYRKGSELLR